MLLGLEMADEVDQSFVKVHFHRMTTEYSIWLVSKIVDKEAKGMFGNCFFPLFSVFKNNFLFLKLKNLFDNSNGQKTKTVCKTQFVKKTENMQNVIFSF